MTKLQVEMAIAAGIFDTGTIICAKHVFSEAIGHYIIINPTINKYSDCILVKHMITKYRYNMNIGNIIKIEEEGI